jgi:hypothetical protein
MIHLPWRVRAAARCWEETEHEYRRLLYVAMTRGGRSPDRRRMPAR